MHGRAFSVSMLMYAFLSEISEIHDALGGAKYHVKKPNK